MLTKPVLNNGAISKPGSTLLGSNINGARRGLPYPTAGLQVIVYNQTYEDGGTTYIRTSKGIGLPVISGTGLDRIIDFTPLNDVRFDKSNATYWGSSLDSWFYYDEENPYHAKLKDFHYRYFENQMASDHNFCFSKFVYQSTILQSVDRAFIYSSELTGANLLIMQNYIDIREDFYADNQLDNMGADGETDFLDTSDPVDGLADKLNLFIAGRGIPEILTGSGFNGNYQKITANLASATALVRLNMKYTLGEKYRFKFKHINNNGLALYIDDRTHYVIQNYLPSSVPVEQIYYFEPTATTTTGYVRFYIKQTSGAAVNDYICIDECACEKLFSKYYKNESGYFTI